MAQHTLHTESILSGDAIVSLRRHPLRLEVVKGPDKKLRTDFKLDRIVIGSHESADFVLSDPKASRQHCEIALVGTGWAIRDLDSTNGTFIDRLRIGEVIIGGDLKLRVGDSTIRLLPLDETVDIELATTTQFGPLRGRSPAMRRVFELLAKVAKTHSTVLISGESGTGKELAARAIHEASPRAKGPFVVVDCGALPSHLAESELYGHIRGAYTGAVRDRKGAFETASGGTLFLDELGELPLDMQTRLLGVLERRCVQPVGSTDTRDVDVRVLAATNRDLRKEINRGSFREDLYFRLAVVNVDMPPLRERPEDIELYVQAFMEEMKQVAPGLSIDEQTIDKLKRERWPGNVRELRNVLERAAALGEVGLSTEDAANVAVPSPSNVDPAVPFKVGKALLVAEYERSYCEKLMAAHDQNITQAARSAEIDRVYLLRLLDKFGLRPSRKNRG